MHRGTEPVTTHFTINSLTVQVQASRPHAHERKQGPQSEPLEFGTQDNTTMTCILSLPIDIMLIVLGDFLGDHKTISAMDIACSQSCRPVLLSVLEHPAFRLIDQGASSVTRIRNYVNWLNVRRVRLQKIKLRACTAMALTELLPRALESVREAELEDMSKERAKKITDAFFTVLYFLKNLNKVQTSAKAPADISPLAQHPALPLKCIQGNLTNQCLQRLVAVFRGSLEELVLANPWTESAFPSSLIAQCSRLNTLSLPEHDLALADLTILLDRLPSLRNLSFNTSNRGVFMRKDNALLEGMQALAPRFKHLERLAFSSGFSNETPRVFISILTECPQLQELMLLSPIKYKVLDGDGQCALTLRWWGWSVDFGDDDGQTLFCTCLRACPVPIAELETLAMGAETLREIVEVAGPSLRKLSLGSYSEQWRENDINGMLAGCTVLRSLTWRVASELTNQRLHLMIHSCPHLEELSIGHAKRITDVGMADALTTLGPRLTKLVLDQCAKVSQHTLNAITQCCTDLRELVILQTLIKAGNILDSIILPDKLKNLSRLGVTAPMHKTIMESSNGVEKTRFRRCLQKAQFC